MKLKHTLNILLPVLAALLLSACSDSGKFTVKGHIEGNPSMNLYVMYYDGTAVRSAVTVARAGQFEVEGSSKQPALIEFLDNDYRVLGRIVASNGDKVECMLSRTNPYKIKATGNPALEEWTDFSYGNADILSRGGRPANDLIERYIAAHPDSPAGSLLFATAYDGSVDPVRADSVMQSISGESRVSRVLDPYATVSSGAVPEGGFPAVDTLRLTTIDDTLHTFIANERRGRIFVFTTEYAQHADSAKHRIRRANSRKGVEVVEVIFTPDTLAWKRAIRRDTATWTQAWTPGGLLSVALRPFALPRVPYVVAVDSAGRQIWRGTSIDSAAAHL